MHAIEGGAAAASPGALLRMIPLHHQGVLSAMIAAGEVECVESVNVNEPGNWSSYMRLRE